MISWLKNQRIVRYRTFQLRFATGVGRNGDLIEGCNAGLAHRLDVETSGGVLVGKTDQAWENLRDQFHNHQVYKEYLCLTNGVVRKGGFVEKLIRPADMNIPKSKSSSKRLQVGALESRLFFVRFGEI